MTKQEIENLKRVTSRKVCILIHSAMLAVILMTLIGSAVKIQLAHQLASKEGTTLSELFMDPEFHGQYSGLYVTASTSLVEGVYRSMPALLYILIWILLNILIKQRKQILELHESNNRSET